MRVVDLLRGDPAHWAEVPTPEMDPLTESGALQEAQVLDVRFDALSSVAAVLFELRQALQLREHNTGVLVAHGVRELAWSGPPRQTALTAWSIVSSVPRSKDGLLELSLVMWLHPDAALSLTAERAAFFVGDVPGLAAAPPDYSDRDRVTLDREVAGWDSAFWLTSAVSFDPAARR